MSYDIERGRKAAKEFMANYNRKHALCPQCRTKNYTSTLLGYVPTIRADYTVSDNFKDENDIMCACGWEGITHDLIEEKQ